MSTIYQPLNAAFSEQAHRAARTLIYPALFRVSPERLEFEATQVERQPGEDFSHSRNSILDGDLKVDRLVRVNTSGESAPFLFTIQERFRRTKYHERYGRQVCLTKRNLDTRQPSEFFNACADFLVYGWFEDQPEGGYFLDAVVIDLSRVKMALVRGELSYGQRDNDKRQLMAVFNLDELQAVGAVVWKMIV
jgi:hypothetical protein